MTKIYIAGPMSGLAHFNRPAFHDAAHGVIEQGHTPLNPATLPNGLKQSEYMDICFAMARAADRLIMLPGWEQSAGAVAEYHYAKKLGLPIEKLTAEAPALIGQLPVNQRSTKRRRVSRRRAIVVMAAGLLVWVVALGWVWA